MSDEIGCTFVMARTKTRVITCGCCQLALRLAEANAAAVARDAKVAEIVAEWLGSDNAPWPMTRALEHTIAIAALYGATRDHIAALRAVDDSDIVPGSEFDGPVIL